MWQMNRFDRRHLPPAAALLLALCSGEAPAQPAQPAQPAEHQHGAHAGHGTEELGTGQLGTVHFATSCAPAVAAEFDRATALLHSFWYRAAIESYQRVLAQDPTCAIAYWGIALAHWGNPFGGFRSPEALRAGGEAIARGQALTFRTERERDWVAAAATLYADAATVDQRTRTLAYERAMRGLQAKYPDDSEARIFFALALDQTALPADKTYANLLEAAAILERELELQPGHPGISHYIIHSYDVPALAARALAAARSYARIAPAAAHALHMPSHTFTRLGYWQESIDTNLRSAAAARSDNSTAEELHAYDYQVYAYLQTGQDQAAARVLSELPPVAARLAGASANAAPQPAGLYALAAIPARLALERAAWSEAAALVPRETAFRWIDAVTYFARALGAARSGQPERAREDLERLAALRDGLTLPQDRYWADQIEIQRLAAEAWIAYATGDGPRALALLRSAADSEDATEKSAISPGPLKPAREMLGELLLELGRPAEALAELELTLKKEPGRFRALYGAARAAEESGAPERAAALYRELAAVCARADLPARAELVRARSFASGG